MTSKVAVDKKFSQFSVDKFELKNGSSAIETSLVDVLPGLKLEFKGDDKSKGDFSALYKIPHATITGDVDIVNFSFAKASISSGFGPVAFGGSGHLESKDGKLSLKDFSFGAGYTIPKLAYVGVKASKKASDYVGNFLYTLNKDVTLAGSVTYPKPIVALGATYKCNPATAMKLKVSTDGKVGFSTKQTVDGTTSITSAVALDINNIGAYKFGITASLG